MPYLNTLRLFTLTLSALFVLPRLIGHAQAPCEENPKACPDRLDFESARGLGLGLGLRATAMSTSALAYNPAALVLGRSYHMEGNVDYLGASNTVALGGSIADSATGRLAGAVAVRGFLSGDHGGYDGWDSRLALALPLTAQLAIGLSARYLDVGTEVATEDGGSWEDQDVVSGFTMDASVGLRLGSMVHLAVMAYNFIDRESPLLPVMGGASLALTPLPELTLGIDGLLDFTSFGAAKLSFGTGVEYMAAQTFPLRIGYSLDSGRKLHRLTFGIGYTDQMVGLEVGLRKDIAGGDDTRVYGALRLYVD